MKFEERVLKNEFQLNDTDEDIINYIRKNRSHIHQISIQMIANELYTVPNSIMRLSKKLGYTGFAQLKILLQEEDYKMNSIGKTKIPDNIMRTIELIDYDQLYDVEKKMKTCKTIYFLGVGDSGLYCEMMVKNLRCVNKKTECYTDYHEIDFLAQHCDKNDLLFFISASGENKRLVDIAKKARKRKIMTVSMTHFYKNSLSLNVDIPLYFYGEPQQINGYNVNDRTGLMIVLRELSELFWREHCV